MSLKRCSCRPGCLKWFANLSGRRRLHPGCEARIHVQRRVERRRSQTVEARYQQALQAIKAKRTAA